jgi:hypothetical protein
MVAMQEGGGGWKNNEQLVWAFIQAYSSMGVDGVAYASARTLEALFSERVRARAIYKMKPLYCIMQRCLVLEVLCSLRDVVLDSALLSSPLLSSTLQRSYCCTCALTFFFFRFSFFLRESI